MAFDADGVQFGGELVEEHLILPDVVRFGAPAQAVGGQVAGDLADVPFDGVKPEAAIGDVGGAEVLGCRGEVAYPDGQQGAERDFEGHAGDVDVVVAAGRGVQVDAVRADADGVRVAGPAALVDDGAGDVVLGDGGDRADAPRFADVRRFGQAVGGADDIMAEPEAGESGAAVGAGGASVWSQ